MKETIIFETPEHVKEFNQLRIAAEQHHEAKDCTVKALALACAVDYSEALKYMTLAGRKRRSGASISQTVKAVHSLGMVATKVPLTEIKEHYPPCYRVVKALTPRQVQMFPKAFKGHTYLAFTINHCLVIRDAQVIDWTEGRYHQIKWLYRIEEKA